jgi:hypothetical protein
MDELRNRPLRTSSMSRTMTLSPLESRCRCVENVSIYCHRRDRKRGQCHIGLSYRVALAVGKEVCSSASTMGDSCHNATPIPVLHVPAEIVPTRARPTGSYCPRVGKLGVNRKHKPLLLIGDMVVQVDGYGREACVVVDRNGIRQVPVGLTTGECPRPGKQSEPIVIFGADIIVTRCRRTVHGSGWRCACGHGAPHVPCNRAVASLPLPRVAPPRTWAQRLLRRSGQKATAAQRLGIERLWSEHGGRRGKSLAD